MVCSVLGPVSLAFGPGQTHLRLSRYWGAGLVALAGGLALISLRDHASSYVTQVAGMGLVALALTFAQSSALKIFDKNARDIVGWILLGVIALALHVLEGITTNAWLHEVVGMGTIGFLCCRVAYGFDRSRELRGGRPLRTLAFIFGFFGLLMVMNGASTLAAVDPDGPLEASAFDELMLVGLIAGLLLGTILILWIMTERINVRMRRLAALDALTGALIRPVFVQAFEHEVARTRRRPDSPLAILLLNIDSFRRVNDAYGHGTGDRLLAAIVEIARSVIRKYDLIGRLEGDKFAVLMPGTAGESAAGMAERLRREIEQRASTLASLKNAAAVSVGVAVFGEHGERWEDLLRAANAAALSARANGGNRVAGAPRPAGPAIVHAATPASGTPAALAVETAS